MGKKRARNMVSLTTEDIRAAHRSGWNWNSWYIVMQTQVQSFQLVKNKKG
jgi:hypothetical protein